jgi:hypothetical protein
MLIHHNNVLLGHVWWRHAPRVCMKPPKAMSHHPRGATTVEGVSTHQGCNVPTLGHHYIIECYDDQSSQMAVIASTWTIEGILGSSLHHSSYFIIMIHSAQLGFGSVSFRRFP